MALPNGILGQVHSWVEEAAQIALGYFNVVEARIKADRSLVTAADTEIEALLRQRIAAAYPDHVIIGEEQGGRAVDAEYIWGLDPIDGTSSFVQGLPIWGISAGLFHRGAPLLGCFYMPLVREWYEVEQGAPATFNGKPLEVFSGDLLGPETWIGVPSNVHRRYRIDFPGKVRSLGSTAAAICYVARGTAAGAVVGRPYVWDIAAALPILTAAGGELRELFSGAAVDLPALLRGKLPAEPLIAGSPEAVALLRPRIEVRGR